ncbi:MAG: peptide chain release factor 1, partial [Spirochaetales bacterium]|nr:peptide chain release factor 1 [Spirochaetales bacterium]
MNDKLEAKQRRFHELELLLASPDATADQKRYRDLTQEYSDLSELVQTYERSLKILEELAESRRLAETETDPEMKALAREEVKQLEDTAAEIETELKRLLVPRDPLDGKNIIMEIRAGTGGEEAALFAADLFRMYGRYAELKHWKVEIIEASETELKGFKEIIFSISGKSVYGELRYESGGHRVQRVPVTEANGRIQTSAATVAVLPEAEETDVVLQDKDLKIDVFRSSGPGGQSVNTTDSAVRVTHLPTGLVVQCQDEKSQLKNKQKALKVLRSRLLELEEQKKANERAADRKSQVGT